MPTGEQAIPTFHDPTYLIPVVVFSRLHIFALTHPARSLAVPSHPEAKFGSD